MAMVPTGMSFRATKLIFAAEDVQGEMASQRDSPKAFIIEYCTCTYTRRCNFPQVFFIKYCFHEYADIHVAKEPQHWIPHVVLVIFVVVRSGQVGTSK